jgi:quercetin dioxygenase-like cupin family protein
MRRFVLMAVAALGVSVFYWSFNVTAVQNLDPLKVAGDTHKLAMENKLVRVLETRIPPGKSEPMHEHRHGVVVYLTDFRVRSTEKGGKPQEFQRRRGEVRWREMTVHEVTNIGKTEGHVISVELK